MAEPAIDTGTLPDIDRMVRGAMPQAVIDRPKIEKGLTEAAEGEAKERGAIAAKMKRQSDFDVAEVHKRYEGIEPADVKPWDAKAAKQEFSTDPISAFGSVGFIAAQLASAFTRTPMVNALNAGGAAIQAMNDKNDKDYDRAYTAWKDNTNLAIKRHEMQREAYTDATKLMDTDMKAGTVQMELAAIKFGDQRRLALVRGGHFEELAKLDQADREAYLKLGQILPQIEQTRAKQQAAQYLKEQGKTPAEIYHEIYAPAYSNTVGQLKAQMIRDDMAKGMSVEDAVRKAESTFKPADAAKTEPAKYAKEFLENTEKSGIILDPTTKALIQQTLGGQVRSAKAAETASRVAQAAEELKLRQASDNPLKPGEADQIIRDAVATETPQKIDQAIVNMLPQYPDMDRRKLGYIGVKNQERIINAVQSAEQIEHIADYAAMYPEAVGIVADAARRINVDAYKGLITKPSEYISKITNDRDNAIDAAVRDKGLSQGVADRAKVLNKMLATQAFADAAQAGSRGATIYLDKAFREIYQQASSLPAFFDILHTRQRDSDMNLARYNLDLAKRQDADERFPFWKSPDKFLERAASSKSGPLPPKKDLVVGQSYPVPGRGRMVWGGDGFYTAEEWAKRSK